MSEEDDSGVNLADKTAIRGYSRAVKTPVETMLREHLMARGICDPRVLEAMAQVPREQFVPAELKKHAYDDRPLPIGHEQTISQPYIVASMIALARITPDSVVLDVGTGCGYMAAVIASIAKQVCTLECIPELAEMAARNFETLGITNIEARLSDGNLGWPEDRQFDAILVSCAPTHVPENLLKQLKPGGRMILPISRGGLHQILTSYNKAPDGKIEMTEHMAVRFVPMV
jgi:protein-L-isoaspartate(D-aspartate) O-methyltransferase